MSDDRRLLPAGTHAPGYTQLSHSHGLGLNVDVNGPKGEILTESDKIVLAYLGVVETMLHCMKTATMSDPDGFQFGGRLESDEEQRDYSRNIWMLLKRAKLIAIPPEMYARLYHKWDRAIVEEAGYSWRPPNFSGKPAPKEEAEEILRLTKSKTLATPFPERLPFDVVYLAYGLGVGQTPFQLMNKTNLTVANRMRNVVLLGTLVSSMGICIDFFIGTDTQSSHPNVPTIFNSFQRGPKSKWEPWTGTTDGVGWLGPDGTGTFDLLPFILSDIIDHINGFVDLSVSRLPKLGRKQWRVERKRFGVEKGEPPPDFYPYVLRSSVHHESVGDVERPRASASYRTDVRGHPRLLVRKGARPMKPEMWSYYTKNGFKVYIDDSPPRGMREKMRVKGHTSKRPDEWLAVKELWIDSHMSSNNTDLPYRRRLTIAQ